MNFKKIIDNVLDKIENSIENNQQFSKGEFEKNRPLLWKVIGKLFPQYRNYPFHNLIKFKNLSVDEKIFLEKIKKINGMSTLANALLINNICKNLVGKNYINVGCWEGFTLLSGMINTECNVYGIDNFSQFGGPKKKFYRNFNKYKNYNHYFYEIDYKIFFKDIWEKENKNIDLYFYDGNHSYEDQLEALEIAKKYFVKNSLIVVDDTNIPDVNNATLNFINKYNEEFKILLDIKTASNGHFTFWNGLMIFVKQ